jgi:ubiquinone/menaquinone biosynthesis C-methylase UbiE
MSILAVKHGDFTGLAENYARFRPGYSETVLSAILGTAGKPASSLDMVDVGAGTGIWTRMLAARHPQSITAIEPNDDMRTQGERANDGLSIKWRKGSGENTGLADSSADVVSMASSFHWVDFDKGTEEFHRILRPSGCFVALWNPRYIDDNPLLVDIEQKLHTLKPSMQRVSSGKSAFVEELTARFAHHPLFHDPVYLEGRHTSQLTPEQYLGVWNSVNDIRAQLGEASFQEFMRYVEKRIADMKLINCTYLTRAWVIRVRK